MGNYTNLLSVVIDIYFSNDPDTFYDKFKSLLETNKKLNLKTKFMCSGLNIIQLLIRYNKINCVKLALDYDKTIVNEKLLKEVVSDDNQSLFNHLLNSYKKTVDTTTFLKQLNINLDTSILKKYTKSFKAICNHLYILDKNLKYINQYITPYKSKKYLYNSKITTLYLNYPCFFIPFKRHHSYPRHVVERLDVIYQIDLPDELIDTICTHWLNMII